MRGHYSKILLPDEQPRRENEARVWRRDGKDGKREEGSGRGRRGRSGSPPIYRTSAPLGTETVMTPRPSRTPPVVLRGPLVAFVPCCPSRCSCSEVPSPLFHREIVLRRSSSTASSFFLLGHRQRALIPTAPLISCPCFHSVRVLLFSSRSMSPSSSLGPLPSVPFCLFLPLPPSHPRPSFPRPRTLRPVVAFFCFLLPRVALVFLPARRQVRGCSRMGRLEGRGRG